VVPNAIKANSTNIFRESLTMKITALQSFKALGATKPAIQYYIPEDLNHLKQHCASIKSCNPSKI
jgi:hypothetical protein